MIETSTPDCVTMALDGYSNGVAMSPETVVTPSYVPATEGTSGLFTAPPQATITKAAKLPTTIPIRSVIIPFLRPRAGCDHQYQIPSCVAIRWSRCTQKKH